MVVDASVLVNALADDHDDGDRARERLQADSDVHAPELLDLEVLSVLRRGLRSGALDERRTELAVTDLRELAVIRYPHLPLVEPAWRHRHNLTVYDAAYVALAELLDCVLVTADERIAGAAHLGCVVELVR